jgi:hypothetical protein
MQSRIQDHPKYDDEILDNPVRLMEEIKVLTHDTVRAQYPIASIVEQLAKWLNIQQHEDENLTEYVKRVKYHRDIVKSQIGTDLLHEHVKQTEKYTKTVLMTERTQLLQDSFEELSAYIVLKGCDKAKYKSLVRGFINQYSLKNDQYPKTVQDMTDALSKHSFDDEYYKRQKRKSERKKSERREKGKEDDGDDKDDELSFAQAVKNKQYACYKCGKSDHPLRSCKLDIPKKEWWINRMVQGMQDKEEESGLDYDEEDDSSQSSRKRRG